MNVYKVKWNLSEDRPIDVISIEVYDLNITIFDNINRKGVYVEYSRGDNITTVYINIDWDWSKLKREPKKIYLAANGLHNELKRVRTIDTILT